MLPGRHRPREVQKQTPAAKHNTKGSAYVPLDMESAAFDGADASQRRKFASIASLLIEQLLYDMPTYTCKPGELVFAGAH